MYEYFSLVLKDIHIIYLNRFTCFEKNFRIYFWYARYIRFASQFQYIRAGLNYVVNKNQGIVFCLNFEPLIKF